MTTLIMAAILITTGCSKQKPPTESKSIAQEVKAAPPVLVEPNAGVDKVQKPSQQITGSWTSTRSGTEMAISPDGSWLTRNMVPGHTNTFSGTWQVKDGFFIMTLTNSPNPNRPASAGDVVRYKIIRMDEHQFIYEDSGRAVTLTR